MGGLDSEPSELQAYPEAAAEHDGVFEWLPLSLAAKYQAKPLVEHEHPFFLHMCIRMRTHVVLATVSRVHILWCARTRTRVCM